MLIISNRIFILDTFAGLKQSCIQYTFTHQRERNAYIREINCNEIKTLSSNVIYCTEHETYDVVNAYNELKQ